MIVRQANGSAVPIIMYSNPPTKLVFCRIPPSNHIRVRLIVIVTHNQSV